MEGSKKSDLNEGKYFKIDKIFKKNNFFNT